jgi:hypothetical protein
MPRRLLAVALAGALALTGLTACRDQPTAAAYVGDAQLSNADVEKAVDQFPAVVRDDHAGIIRQNVVSAFVTREVATHLAKDRKLAVPAADTGVYQDEAAFYKVSPSIDYYRLSAERDAAVAAVSGLGTPQAPTDDLLRNMYAQLVQSGSIPASIPIGQVQLDTPDLRAVLGLRAVLEGGVKNDKVTVNPRYHPLAITFGLTLGISPVTGRPMRILLSIPLDVNASPAVVDAR